MSVNGKNSRNVGRLWTAIGSVAIFSAPVIAGTNIIGPASNPTALEETVSISGSTALKNFITGPGFTDLVPNASITLPGDVVVPNGGGVINPDGSITFTAGSGGLQLAPTTFGTSNSAGSSINALRVEYHESGSVEGILELANDQIEPQPYVAANIDRNPNGGNAVWVNGNQIGGVGAPNGNSLTPPHNDPGNNILGPFYGTDTAGNVVTFTGGTATFNQAGQNISPVSSPYTQAGQNAVQIAISDVVPQQAFQNDYSASSTVASAPWLSTPQNLGYGQGNTALASGGLGVAGGHVNLQSSTTLNMPAAAINPRTGGTFGAGPWNTAGLGNLTSQASAVSATVFVANPGTGLDRLDQTDEQWLQTTGRLANGAAFEMTTRDVNSGTRNVAALDSGIDPSFAVGVNDSGNGNAASGATSQISVGGFQLTLGPTPINIGTIRYSEKTAGGAQLRPTVEDARMAVGTLSVGDANGVFATGNAYGLRALDYSPAAAGSSAAYVQVSTYSIVNGLFVPYQNEQYVTLKAPQTDDSSFDTLTTLQWAAVNSGGTVAIVPTLSSAGTVPIQGDDSTGVVSQLLANIQSAVSNPPATFTNAAVNYVQKGFILPQDMAVEKNENGEASFPNPIYNASQSNNFLSTSFTTFTTGSDPDSITAHVGDTYGGKGTNVAAFNGVINQTVSANVNGATAGGNWLFGNFNQNGIRDFDAVVVTGEQALAALESSGAGVSSFSGGSNNTVIPGLPAPLATMTNEVGGIGATKGDLIMMGDFDGRGVFDGQSLYELAVGASLANNVISGPVVPGVNDRITLQGETLTVLGVNTRDGSTGTQTAVATTVNTESFGDAVRRAVLDKNAALDYLNMTATTQMKEEAAAVLNIPGTTAPAGSTTLGSDGVNVYFTYDPTGANSFNKSDVNRDGTIDLNDAFLVDKFNGQSYSNMGDQIQATEQAPVTGATEPANLVLVSQIDGEAAIGSADLAVENTALTGTGNSNLYGYTVQKTGPGTVSFARTGGTVTVYSGANIEVSAGTLNVAGTIDPFSDNNASGSTAGNHAALTVDGGGKVTLAPSGGRLYHVSNLTINTTSGSSVDVGNNQLDIDNAGTNEAAIVALLASGRNGGAWTGPGINSSVAAAGMANQFSVGYLAPTDRGGKAGETITRYVLSGDAFLEGSVGFDDLVVVAQNFGFTGEDWAGGNFNYDPTGAVGFPDLVNVAENFGFSSGGPLLSGNDAPLTLSPAWEVGQAQTTAVTPEPTSIALIGLGATALLARRRRSMR